ncbi:hypothetical protein HHA33_10800 [Phytobacter diazotrophicus]|uniref:hypothetical protein n=1 Tax=Phytobacter diazotrophicus TaxID=395631 RepID=UPI001451DB18|nr:hypothetical protein [Phytobacter diazotrophicus]QJF16999.1 hypothetical protein HHA33_10800 [Phytobacter diazotrophicus]
MNFEDLSFEMLDQYAMERLVFDEEELSPILKGHIFIEKILENLISRNFVDQKVFFKSTRSFDLKVDLALAMGLIDEKYYSAFKAINKVRNGYAHKHDYKVSLAELNAFKFDWESIQNKAYKVACNKGIADAARIATIFLCWKAIHLISSPEE